MRLPVKGQITENAVFRAARNKLSYEGARTKLLQLICEVAQIVPYCYFWGFIYLLNLDKTISIAV